MPRESPDKTLEKYRSTFKIKEFEGQHKIKELKEDLFGFWQFCKA